MWERREFIERDGTEIDGSVPWVYGDLDVMEVFTMVNDTDPEGNPTGTQTKVVRFSRRVLRQNPAAVIYNRVTVEEFLEAMGDTVEDEFLDLLESNAAARKFMRQAELRGVLDFSRQRARNGLQWLVANTSLTGAEAVAIAGGPL